MRKFIGMLIEWFLSYSHTVIIDGDMCKPFREYNGDAGYDLCASKTVVIPPLHYGDILCSLKFELPEGLAFINKGRSYALRSRGVIVIDGIIDGRGRGEIFSCVYNTKDFPITIYAGECISQVVPQRIVPLKFIKRGKL
jgi:dUTPase